MKQEDAIKWKKEIIAFAEGKVIQVRIKGTLTWYDIEDEFKIRGNWEYRIKPDKIKRLPTNDEVFQWFRDGKVFKLYNVFVFCKIEGLVNNLNKNNFSVRISNEWFTITKLVNTFTDEFGNPLMIEEDE
jgi:hypothetical protein